jgi:signal transduction histidine kinase
MSENGGQDSCLSSLVQAALDQDQLSGYCEMLRVVAQSIDCDACIVWRVAPGSNFDSEPPVGRLFAVAQWFKEAEFWTTHKLSLTSATGTAVRSRRPDLINDIHNHEGVDPNDAFFTLTKMKKFCTIPVEFTRDVGAVTVYRFADIDITETEFARAQRLAKVVPRLYRTIHDRASFVLMQNVNEKLREAEAMSTAPEEAMKQVSELVKRTFRCLETSVFLENPNEKPGIHHCYYTTEESFVGGQADYTPTDTGLTPWALQHNHGVQIFDLRYFEEDLQQIRARYEGIGWIDRQAVIRRAVQGSLPHISEPDRIPVSFMVTPIVIGGVTRGAIRCCLAISPPYYFSLRDLLLLELIASRIGQYWGHHLALQESQSKARFWEYLAEGVRRMNAYVHGELSKEEPNKLAIYQEALKIIDEVIPEAGGSNVRLADSDKNDLIDVRPSGGEVRRFPLSDPASSAGVAVFQNGEPQIFTRGARPGYSGEFGDSSSAVVAPIWSGQNPIGVLDIVWKVDRPPLAELKRLAELWGRQLGLYDHLAGSITELKTATDQRIQAYIDLEHQLMGPLMTALRRVQGAVKEGSEIDLFALRGQLRKAYRVSRNIPLFATLAKEEAPPVSLARLDKEKTLQSIIEYCMDFKLARRGVVGFHVYPEGFEHLERNIVEADPTLFEQAVNNVLDNAFKYSLSGETVEVRAGVESDRWFYVSVRDKGLEITLDEVRHCKKREWRSKDAMLVTGEGSGVGMWIIDGIMKAHEGTLEVYPTRRGITEVRLQWRIKK